MADKTYYTPLHNMLGQKAYVLDQDRNLIIRGTITDVTVTVRYADWLSSSESKVESVVVVVIYRDGGDWKEVATKDVFLSLEEVYKHLGRITARDFKIIE